MKHTLALSLFCLLSLGYSTEVNSKSINDEKIDLIKQVYLEYERHPNEYEYKIIAKHSTPELRKAIKRFEKVREHNEDCDAEIYSLKLIEGNGYGVEDILERKFHLKGENRVIAQLIMSGGDTLIEEFSVIQHQKGYLIQDLFDDQGKSALKSIRKNCGR